MGFTKLDVRYVDKLAIFALPKDQVFVFKLDRARCHPNVVLVSCFDHRVGHTKSTSCIKELCTCVRVGG